MLNAAIDKSLLVRILKRLLEFGISVYLILILIILITGGFETGFLGLSIRATHLFTPVKILVPLIILRVLISTDIKQGLLLAVSLFISLCVMEVALRIWDPPIAKPEMGQVHRASSIFGWELIPGAAGVGSLGERYQINSAGFRDIEHSLEKEAGVPRIMVIGGSFTFGMGVNLEDTYPKQLERVLNSTKRRCEVMNCGVVAYNMWQHYEMLKKKVLPYRPDLVILTITADDITRSVPPYKDTDEYKGENPFEKKGFSRVMSHFSLWNFFENICALYSYKYRYRHGKDYMKGIEERKKVWGPANPTDSNYKIMSGKIEEQRRKEFSDKLKQFVMTAKTGGAEVLMVFIPDSVQLNDPHMQAINRIVGQICRETGVPFSDVTPFLEAEKDHGALYLFPFDAHNSPKGLSLIAESIANQIIKLGLLSLKN